MNCYLIKVQPLRLCWWFFVCLFVCMFASHRHAKTCIMVHPISWKCVLLLAIIAHNARLYVPLLIHKWSLYDLNTMASGSVRFFVLTRIVCVCRCFLYFDFCCFLLFFVFFSYWRNQSFETSESLLFSLFVVFLLVTNWPFLTWSAARDISVIMPSRVWKKEF